MELQGKTASKMVPSVDTLKKTPPTSSSSLKRKTLEVPFSFLLFSFFIFIFILFVVIFYFLDLIHKEFPQYFKANSYS